MEPFLNDFLKLDDTLFERFFSVLELHLDPDREDTHDAESNSVTSSEPNDTDEEDDIDGVDCDGPDDRESLEFEYEPGISLSSLQFYQTCECQNDSETGEQNIK